MTTSLFSLDFDAIAEERIQAAIRRGEFDNLPGAGKPLRLDDDLLVPPEARIANRILKNAGLVPVEVEQRREIAELEAGVAALRDEAERAKALQKLALLRLALGARRSMALARNEVYRRRIAEKLGALG